jgi:hypothetical protein
VSRAASDQAFLQAGAMWTLHLRLALDCCPLRLAGLTHRTALHPFFLSSSVPAHSHEAEVIVICRSSTIDRGLARLQTLQLDKVEIGAQGWQPWNRGLVSKKRQWSLYGLCKGSTGMSGWGWDRGWVCARACAAAAWPSNMGERQAGVMMRNTIPQLLAIMQLNITNGFQLRARRSCLPDVCFERCQLADPFQLSCSCLLLQLQWWRRS